jgi:hypothetical protein
MKIFFYGRPEDKSYTLLVSGFTQQNTFESAVGDLPVTDASLDARQPFHAVHSDELRFVVEETGSLNWSSNFRFSHKQFAGCRTTMTVNRVQDMSPVVSL